MEAKMDSLDEQVAAAVIAEFMNCGLLPEASLEKIKNKLAAGQITQEDWKLLFELSGKKMRGGE
jgi:hypothetical protein